jgi:hypothetical protein
MRQASIFLVEDEALIRMMVAEAGNIQDAQVLAAGGACRSFLSAVMDQRPDRKHS